MTGADTCHTYIQASRGVDEFLSEVLFGTMCSLLRRPECNDDIESYSLEESMSPSSFSANSRYDAGADLTFDIQGPRNGQEWRRKDIPTCKPVIAGQHQSLLDKDVLTA